MNNISGKHVIGGMLLLAATSASALPTYYNNRAAFQAAVTGPLSLESFEGPGQLGATHTYTDFQVSETGGTNFITNYLANSLLNPVTEGTNAIWFDDNGNSVGTFFNFTGGSVFAIGLDITVNETSTVSIGGSNINASVLLAANQPQFWGVIDTSGITTITFSPNNEPNIGFDYVQYQLETVPEPATLALMGLGLAGLRFRRNVVA